MREIIVSPTGEGESVIPQFIPVENFYWSSPLLDRIVDAIDQGKITSGADWRKIATIVSLVSDEKRIRFYHNLERIGLSRASLDFLFDNWHPGEKCPPRRAAPWKAKPQ